ncbi:penicillin acylase family protein [Henriciella marina]|uniref:penicillin acylase family protein n=1 Tax=Henriciella marina TaxID=453851 RepID=UPI000375F18E|nr:penicillin acylase family protein [Henriciella marina]
MRILKWGLALVVLVLIGLAVWLWDPVGSNPPPDDLAAASAAYDVEIIRDNWGVPHIYGARDADVVFGVAYAHAEDDYETIQNVVAAGRGVLARYDGAGAAPTDYIVALLGVWDTMESRYESDVPASVKAIAEAYAAGLNLYAAEHPDATWAGLAPFTAEDVVAGFVFKTPFFYGLDSTLMGLFGDEREAAIALDPSGGREAFHAVPKGQPERGSNAFAVSPERSGDGVTRLVINSHQPMTGPVAWWEAQLVSEEGLNMTGGLFPGTPLILHGFNADLGWANTVNKPDLADVYRLEVNETGDQYRLDGAWRDFEEETVKIRVGLFGPFAFKAKRALKSTVHGPVIEAEHGTYAIRYAGRGEIGQLEQYYRLNKARSLDDFMAAMAMNALPSINYIYADRAGNIAFVHNAQYPDRMPGWDWRKDLPGDRTDLVWEDYLPFDEVPMLINPESGLIFNANNTPYSATDGADNLSSDDFPAAIGLQENQTNRSLRIIELTGDGEPIGRERLLDIKFDLSYAEGSQTEAVIAAVVEEDWSEDETLAAAALHLAEWDRSTDRANRHAALGVLTVVQEVRSSFDGSSPPPPEKAFRDAVEWLMTHHGRIDPEWGKVNRLVRGDTDVPLDGGPDTLRAIYPAEIRDDGELHAAAGDTWIALVEWDEDGEQTAEVIHQFGAATLDETSPHYDDQAPLFADMKWRRALIERAAVEENAERTYRPRWTD